VTLALERDDAAALVRQPPASSRERTRSVGSQAYGCIAGVAVQVAGAGRGAQALERDQTRAELVQPPMRTGERRQAVWGEGDSAVGRVSVEEAWAGIGAQALECDDPAGSGHFEDSRLKAVWAADRKSTRLNSSHQIISYAVFC